MAIGDRADFIANCKRVGINPSTIGGRTTALTYLARPGAWRTQELRKEGHNQMELEQSHGQAGLEDARQADGYIQSANVLDNFGLNGAAQDCRQGNYKTAAAHLALQGACVFGAPGKLAGAAGRGLTKIANVEAGLSRSKLGLSLIAKVNGTSQAASGASKAWTAASNAGQLGYARYKAGQTIDVTR